MSIAAEAKQQDGAGPEGVSMYTVTNYKTKKALKEDLKAGKTVEAYQPGLGVVPKNGTVSLEGPHYPEPHRWYAEGTMKDGKLVSIR